MNLSYIRGALLMLFSLSSCAQGVKKFVTNNRSVYVDTLNRNLKEMMNDMAVPGMSLAVIDHGKIVYYNVYGYKQVHTTSKVDKETVFEACSLSKSFLVLAAQQLVAEGKLDLDKPMYQYLINKDLEHDERYKLITARMVLGHCSGIENWKFEHNPDVLEIMSNPGENFVYSGEGYDWLADVISVILHQSYEQYMAQRVIGPLHLSSTFLKFETRGTGSAARTYPDDYAIGHNAFLSAYDKPKDPTPVPAAGVHTTAADYASLILGFFNEKYLSGARIRDMVRPVVDVSPGDSSITVGSGFLVIRTSNDTIISQYGSDAGFKANFLYSVPNQCGFVFFSNADLGGFMTQRLCELVMGWDMHFMFDREDFRQYPTPTFHLLKTLRNQGPEAMFSEIRKMEADKSIDGTTLNEVSLQLMDYDKRVARRLLMEDVKWQPGSALAHQLYGRVLYDLGSPDSAYNEFVSAKNLKPDLVGIEADMKVCTNKLAEMAKKTQK